MCIGTMCAVLHHASCVFDLLYTRVEVMMLVLNCNGVGVSALYLGVLNAAWHCVNHTTHSLTALLTSRHTP